MACGGLTSARHCRRRPRALVPQRLAFIESVFEFGKAVVPAPAETTSAPVETDAHVVREASMMILEAHAARHAPATRPRQRINIFGVAESGDKLLLALAIDRIGRTSRQEFSVVDDRQSDDHPDNDPDLQSLTDDPLAVALAEWRWPATDNFVCVRLNPAHELYDGPVRPTNANNSITA